MIVHRILLKKTKYHSTASEDFLITAMQCDKTVQVPLLPTHCNSGTDTDFCGSVTRKTGRGERWADEVIARGIVTPTGQPHSRVFRVSWRMLTND